MPETFKEWTVLPHGALQRIDDNILTVTGTLRMPIGDFERRMTIVKLADGRLVVFSAIALDEPQMREIEAFGTPSFLIVPNERHRMDLKGWKDRYPSAQVIAPQGAVAKVQEIAPVDASVIDFHDPSVEYFVIPGTKHLEAGLLVHGASGATLILNEVIFNVASQPGVRGWLFDVLGMTGKEPHVPPTVKLLEIDDRAAFVDQLKAWSHTPRLERVIVSHGKIIDRDPAGVLTRIANELTA